MTENTSLDVAYERLEAADNSEAAHRAYLARLSGTQLYLPVNREDGFDPMLIEQDGAQFALAFDSEARLAQFVEGETFRAILLGRDLAQVLAKANLGLGVNLGVAPAAMLLPPDAMAWVAGFETTAQQAERKLTQVTPANLNEAELQSLDGFFSGLAGIGTRVQCAQAHDAETDFPLFVFEGVAENHQDAVAAAVSEHLAMLGATSAPSVLFDPPAALAQRIKPVALTFDLPKAEKPSPPGFDPAKPPRLR